MFCFQLILFNAVPCLILTCHYVSLPGEHPSSASSVVSIERKDGPVGQINLEVDQQRNRLIAAEAMKNAKEAGDINEYSTAQRILDDAVSLIEISASCGSPFCRSLIQDLHALRPRFRNNQNYASGGRQVSPVSPPLWFPLSVT